ncbi:MAG: redoxin domain-containing protein [Bacteroidota bacterium]|nr:redoxin domain-containing protein [Bacteroidota bacterium]
MKLQIILPLLILSVINQAVSQVPDSLYLGFESVNFEGFDPNMKNIKLHEVKSKYTIVYFYDYQCSHCKDQIPVFSTKYDSLHKIGYEYFGVLMTYKADTLILKTAMDNFKLKGINIIPKDYASIFSMASGNFNVTGFPTYFVLDKKKKFISGAIKKYEDLLVFLKKQKK